MFRNIKLKKFFGHSVVKEVCPFKKKSTFVPNITDPAITVFEKLVLKDVSLLEQSRLGVKFNMSKQDLFDLKNLAADTSVIVKPADKGGVIVIFRYK